MSNIITIGVAVLSCVIALVVALLPFIGKQSSKPSSDTKKKESFSDRKIECSHAPYGYTFDYIKQKKERLYGVPLCCQNIF
jgi:hypothetical protein